LLCNLLSFYSFQKFPQHFFFNKNEHQWCSFFFLIRMSTSLHVCIHLLLFKEYLAYIIFITLMLRGRSSLCCWNIKGGETRRIRSENDRTDFAIGTLSWPILSLSLTHGDVMLFIRCDFAKYNSWTWYADSNLGHTSILYISTSDVTSNTSMNVVYNLLWIDKTRGKDKTYIWVCDTERHFDNSRRRLESV
jgi:hypothetical protein